MNRVQKKMMLEEGWLPSEVAQFSRATGGNVGSGTSQRHVVPQALPFNSKPFLAMRRSRRRWVSDLHKLGWTDFEIKLKIREYYNRGSDRSPFDFLKEEYENPKKITDYQKSVKIKIRSRISRTFGKLYGRNLRTATKVRTQPKRPVVPFKPKIRRVIRRRR